MTSAAWSMATGSIRQKLSSKGAGRSTGSKLVIARLSGYALGIGLENARACNFRIASETTQIGLPGMRLGMIPGSGGAQRIARMAGLGRAMDMILRARRLPAEEARSWGLLTEVVPASELDACLDALVDELLAFSPLNYRVGKQALHATMEVPLSTGLAMEGRMYGFLRTTEDFREGVQAFKEKRRPRFQRK